MSGNQAPPPSVVTARSEATHQLATARSEATKQPRKQRGRATSNEQLPSSVATLHFVALAMTAIEAQHPKPDALRKKPNKNRHFTTTRTLPTPTTPTTRTRKTPAIPKKKP
jgi:hypothetical protein